jgi:hypothetical protein
LRRVFYLPETACLRVVRTSRPGPRSHRLLCFQAKYLLQGERLLFVVHKLARASACTAKEQVHRSSKATALPLEREDAGVVRDIEDQEGEQAIETDDRLAADIGLSKVEDVDKSAIWIVSNLLVSK